MSQHHHHQFDPKFRRFHGFLMVYHLILSFLRAIRIAFKRMRRGMMRSLLRVWMKLNRQDRYGRAGFVLPTVTMVLLVVVLLSVTIMLRSMDRSKMAQYRRVDEAVLQAATPALDRAKAKIQDLIVPVTTIQYSKTLNGWIQEQIFPDGIDGLSLKGASFRIFMPLELNGTIKNYSFTFNITDVKQ